MSQPETDADASHQLGSKRSRKSACPKRILQHHQQLLEARAAGICEEVDAECHREDEKKQQRLEPSPHPPLLPTFPTQSPPPLQSDGGADLLRSLATLSPQSLIPTLYAALSRGEDLGGGCGSGGGFFGLGGVVGNVSSIGGGIGNNGGVVEPQRPRGRPKGAVATATMPFRQYEHQHQPQQRRGPRPFDPLATPEPVRIITRKGVAYNRRPRSFYSADIKLMVIEFAEQHGASAAERHFNVPLSTVQSWMRHDNKARIMSTPHLMPVTAAQLPPPLPPPPPPLPLNLAIQQPGRIPLPSKSHR